MGRRDARDRRHRRVRKKVHGTSARPRLAVYKSNRYIYAQIIDDDSGRTVAAAMYAGLPAQPFEAIGRRSPGQNASAGSSLMTKLCG